MPDMTVQERITESQHLRGKIAACAAEMTRLNAALSVHNGAIQKDMQEALRREYGKDYQPRITFYSSEKAEAVAYEVSGFTPKAAS